MITEEICGGTALSGVEAIAGLLLTVTTFAMASGGGTYLLAWGPVLGGVVMVISGLANQAKYREPSRAA